MASKTHRPSRLMFEPPPSYRWRAGDGGYLYGVKEPITVTDVGRGYGVVNGINIAQKHLQKQQTSPHTYQKSMREHSHYLTLSGLDARRPQPWRVLEQRPTTHISKWEKYKTSYSRDDFLRFIRAMCPRVHIDDHYRIWMKDNPKRQLGETVYIHGYATLQGTVRGTAEKGWYLVECALGVCTCHRSTLCTRGY